MIRKSALYVQLAEIADILENYFKDMCEFQFVVEKNQLFILDARAKKATPKANINIIKDLLNKGIINLNDAISRINPEDIEKLMIPVLINSNNLQLITRGLPASNGIATGVASFDRNDVELFNTKQLPVIPIFTTVGPDDIGIIIDAVGIVGIYGGMTSHAAVISRGMQKPCIVGCKGQIKEEYYVNQYSIAKGEFITINGITGELFKGRGVFKNKDWHEIEELVFLAKIIHIATRSWTISSLNIGRCWAILDFLFYSLPLTKQTTLKKAVFNIPTTPELESKDNDLKALQKLFQSLGKGQKPEYKYIVFGLIRFLSRVLSERVGIGNHYKYSRPLINPQNAIFMEDDEMKQIVAIEYFNINKYVPFLIDLKSISIFLKIEVNGHNDLWFLDYTNPRGESLVARGDLIEDYYVLINNYPITHDDLSQLYNSIRLRESNPKFLNREKTSYEELVALLKKPVRERFYDTELLYIANELGLLDGNKLTVVGKSLIEEELPMNRAEESIKVKQENLEKIINSVIERGYDDVEEESDDYSRLIKQLEYRHLITYEIYENYFDPQRHEFELELVKHIVDAVADNKVIIAAYLVGTSQSVIGNGISALIKNLAQLIASKFKKEDRPHRSFMELHDEISMIEEYFVEYDSATLDELHNKLHISHERLLPLLKLLQFRHSRIGRNRVWIKPK